VAKARYVQRDGCNFASLSLGEIFQRSISLKFRLFLLDFAVLSSFCFSSCACVCIIYISIVMAVVALYMNAVSAHVLTHLSYRVGDVRAVSVLPRLRSGHGCCSPARQILNHQSRGVPQLLAGVIPQYIGIGSRRRNSHARNTHFF